MFVKLVHILTLAACQSSGSFTPPTSLISLTYTSTTIEPILNFNLIPSPIGSPLLLVVSTSSSPPSTDRDDWLHYNPIHSHHFDYQALVTAKSQYAWIANPSIATTFHLHIINFDPNNSYSYSFSVSESYFWSQQCTLGYPLSGAHYCGFCGSGKKGVYCLIDEVSIRAGQIASLNLAAGEYKSLVLTGDSLVRASVSSQTGGVGLYVQRQDFKGELAGVINYLESSEPQGYIYFNSSATTVLEVDSQGRNIILGMINLGIRSTQIVVSYEGESNSNILLIVVAVLAGLLLLGVVLIIIALCRKSRQDGRIVEPEEARSQESNHQQQVYYPIRQTRLTRQIVDKLFPVTTLGQIRKIEGQAISDELQCVICLCEIEEDSQVRVGFCRHILHAHCLIQWFRKQQNCPYCRRQYDRQTAQRLLASIESDEGQKVTEDVILRHIFKSKPNTHESMQTIVVEDINDLPSINN